MGRLLAVALLIAAGAVLARRLRGGAASHAPSQPLWAEPDQLPNEPDRSVHATPPPGA